jgi:hypothetical protein
MNDKWCCPCADHERIRDWRCGPRILNFNSTWRSVSCPDCFTDSVGARLETPAALNPFGAERNLMSLLEIETRLVRYSVARKSEIRKVLIPSMQLGRSVLHLSVCCVSYIRHIKVLCVCVRACARVRKMRS